MFPITLGPEVLGVMRDLQQEGCANRNQNCSKASAHWRADRPIHGEKKKRKKKREQALQKSG